MLQLHKRALGIAQRSKTALNEDVLFVKALLEWFKHDFFKWFKKPNCPTIGACSHIIVVCVKGPEMFQMFSFLHV